MISISVGYSNFKWIKDRLVTHRISCLNKYCPIQFWFHEFYINSLSFSKKNDKSSIKSWIEYKFTINFANSAWNHILIREITIKTSSFSRIHIEFTLCFLNSLSNREFIINSPSMNSISVSRNYLNNIFFANLL